MFTLQHGVLRLDRLISLVLVCDAGMKLRATGDQPPAAPLGARVLCVSACPIRAVIGAVYENSPTFFFFYYFLFLNKATWSSEVGGNPRGGILCTPPLWAAALLPLRLFTRADVCKHTAHCCPRCKRRSCIVPLGCFHGQSHCHLCKLRSDLQPGASNTM